MTLTVSSFNSIWEEWEDTRTAEQADVVQWLREQGVSVQKADTAETMTGWEQRLLVSRPGTYVVWRLPDER